VAFKPFESLDVWKEAREFRKAIYGISASLPKREEYVLGNQMRRAAISITANIAEGHGRYHYQETMQFCRAARGSLSEVRDHLYAALDAGYISQEAFGKLQEQAEKVAKLLNGYINYLGRRKQS